MNPQCERMHNGRTIPAALAAFKGNTLSFKNIYRYVRELSYPSTT
jgi:hypothetical protein